ncbi:hypothetical protein CEXT_241461 [Caerostris extrusa]|uniref:Uncharacterized protein n=1 Tax=Caerostris extrusa TaxID=172846 RepID=A0AAV4TLK1_CAEEX|nr:hypothetical protein CEXT_241461 [Caerostris extrusa]
MKGYMKPRSTRSASEKRRWTMTYKQRFWYAGPRNVIIAEKDIYKDSLRCTFSELRLPELSFSRPQKFEKKSSTFHQKKNENVFDKQRSRDAKCGDEMPNVTTPDFSSSKIDKRSKDALFIQLIIMVTLTTRSRNQRMERRKDIRKKEGGTPPPPPPLKI